MTITRQKPFLFIAPILAAGLTLGLLLMVMLFTSDDLHAQATSQPAGQLRLLSNARSRTGDFVLELEQMPPAPSGEHYVLWMQSDEGDLLHLGSLEFTGGRVTFVGSTEDDLLGNYSRALISLESDHDHGEPTLSTVVFSSTLPSELLALSRQLLTGSDADTPALFDQLETQIAIASEQNRLLGEALVVEDFDEVRRRAEQIVNVIDGETGAFFGDLDRDGQVENPGDGVGIRLHLEQAQDLVIAIRDTVSTTDSSSGAIATRAEEVLTMLQESQRAIGETREQTQKIFAADSQAESEAISAEVEARLNDLAAALDTTYATALELATYRFGSPSATNTRAGVGGTGEDALLGQLRLSANESSHSGSFALELVGIPPAPPSEHYELWLQSATDELLRLGEFEVNDGQVLYVGDTELSLLRDYRTALISLEPDGEPNNTSIARVVLSSTLPTPLLTVSRQLLTSRVDEPALYDNLQAQIAIAVEHSGFLVDSLILDDVDEVRRHAEHLVNIIDGETGDFYGDLDRDGQAQNPGDGVGVRIYLEQAHDLSQELSAVVETTDDRGGQTDEILSMIEEGQQLAVDVRSRALDVFSLASELELLEAARDLVRMTTAQSDLVQQEREAILALVTYDFFAPILTSTAAVSATVSPPAPAMVVSPPLATTAGETWSHPLEEAVYIFMPGGEVTMGTGAGADTLPNEAPQHTIEVAEIWVRQNEVTNEQYLRCVAQGACTPPANAFAQEDEFADHPVTHVAWEQANQYATWVGGRLPTEAEWERGCQGADDQEYAWGDAEPTVELSNYGDTIGEPTAVGSYPEGASPFGLLDMSGNVWEWTSSLDQPYPYDAQDGREDIDANNFRIGRGGSFGFPEQSLRCAARLGFHPLWQIPHLGFRVVITAAEE